jgi:hypothetical protein
MLQPIASSLLVRNTPSASATVRDVGRRSSGTGGRLVIIPFHFQPTQHLQTAQLYPHLYGSSRAGRADSIFHNPTPRVKHEAPSRLLGMQESL